MTEFVNMNDLSRISDAYSYLGHKFLSGNIEVAKFLYGNAWKESPPLIKTISQLQYCLTAAEVKKDTTGIYCNEFLYYWGMICIGEVSRLIVKDLGTAKICFKKIIKAVPKAKARLAFIELLLTDEPHKSDSNVERIDTLRKWAGKQDFFSSIVISKIIYSQFLCEEQADNPEQLPILALRLLSLPCQRKHPVAIKFHNEMLDYISTPDALSMKINESHLNKDILYDY
jgi:hypothetical protein